ncbi:29128_t:CDS:2 [Gigaspora margarita]|uniref:29128_t:CDS:1 n=1 Tax=Gigaspora margarita TaxID=4874 RepID=A0ABN7VAP7_GIGMA|nr:29128_t:CDS:2 [Gigaspora margarita]
MPFLKKERIFKFKFENEDAFTMRFQPNIKLQDVRVKLAKHKDYLEAKNLQFVDKDGTLITYECERDYGLEELHDEYSIIHVKLLLKCINVNIDGLEKTCYLDPKDKLTEVRKTMKTIIEGEFLFRKQDGSIIKTVEENSNNLKKFLMNDTLFISILQESEVNIRIYHDKTHHHRFKRLLDKKMNLSQIRSILANNQIINPERMRSNYRFSDHENTLISKFDEEKKKLYEILYVNERGSNVLIILKIDEPDWAKLVNKCGYGFIIDKDSMFVKQIQSPRYRAFTIKATVQPYRGYDYKDSQFECNSEFHELCSKNFITFGKVNFILPFISISFGLDQKLSREKLNSYKTNIKYSYIKIKRATIDIDKSKIDLTDEFKNEIKEALKENTREKKLAKLKEIANNYGHFYARSISFGGVVIHKIKNFKNIDEFEFAEETKFQASLNNNIGLCMTSNAANSIKSSERKSRSTHEIKGGNRDEYHQNDPSRWITSLNDSDNWDIIEYNNVYSIFDLLKNDLRNEVLKVLGKRILKDGIDEIKYPTKKKDPYGHDIGWKLDDISNLENCEIFSTVMKERNRHIFSSCVTYDAPDAPVIMIQRVPSKKKPRRKIRKLKIGWIVIGYPDDSFDLNLSNQVIYESGKYAINPYIPINVPHQTEWSRAKKFTLSTCMLDKQTYSNSDINPYDLKLIFGSNFSILKDHAYLFVYSSEHCNKPLTNNNGSNLFLQHVKLCICTIYVRDDFPESTMFQKEVRWNHMSIRDKIFFSELDAIYTDENKLVFVNQLFENHNRNHGIVNVALGSLNHDSLLCGSLNKETFTKNDLDILYLNYSHEKAKYFNFS